MTAFDVIAYPRDPNPYQELLYEPMRQQGARVVYAGEASGSHLLNLLVLPIELVILKLRGFQVFHIHWVFGFYSTVGGRRRRVRKASRLWFGLVRHVARRAGLTLIWTAHNVLPHTQVFDDDVRARREFVDDVDVVIAHSPQTLDELAALGITVRESAVIPHGPFVPTGVTHDRLIRAGERRLLLFGRIERYKCAEQAILAARELRDPLRLMIAGACSDPTLRSELNALAAPDPRIELRFGFLPDSELAELLDDADVLIFPFRRITTSGSLMLGLASGRAVLIPDLPSLADVPRDAAFRYDPAAGGLSRGLQHVLRASNGEIQATAQLGREYATSVGWEQIAALTQAAYQRGRVKSASDDRRQHTCSKGKVV